MNPRSLCVALAALLVPWTVGWAADVTSVDAATPAMTQTMSQASARTDSDRETCDQSARASGFVVATGARSMGKAFVAELGAIASTPFHGSDVAGTRYESARYRPRRERGYRDYGSRRPTAVSQLHAGYLDPDGPADPGFLVGLRIGQQFQDVVEIGLGADWRNKSGRSTEVLQSTTGPGGETIVVRRELSRYSSNLFPMMAYLQVSGPSSLTLIPYAGVAASYQALFLSADDFQTGQSFDATYDGFGWQLWGGAKLPLSGRTGLVGEVFMNNADLDRDVFDPASGQTIREIVSTDGVGARFGITWGF